MHLSTRVESPLKGHDSQYDYSGYEKCLYSDKDEISKVANMATGMAIAIVADYNPVKIKTLIDGFASRLMINSLEVSTAARKFRDFHLSRNEYYGGIKGFTGLLGYTRFYNAAELELLFGNDDCFNVSINGAINLARSVSL
jgi:hypothetical protein